MLFDPGDEITVRVGNQGIRFLLVSGKSDEEQVAWYGPILMNTEEQLRKAIEELQGGSFINIADQAGDKLGSASDLNRPT